MVAKPTERMAGCTAKSMEPTVTTRTTTLKKMAVLWAVRTLSMSLGCADCAAYGTAGRRGSTEVSWLRSPCIMKML